MPGAAVEELAGPGRRTTVAAGSATGPGAHEPRPGLEAETSLLLPTVRAEAARDAVVARSPTGLVESALARELERLAAEHNGGEPFPPRQRRELRPGWRIG